MMGKSNRAINACSPKVSHLPTIKRRCDASKEILPITKVQHKEMVFSNKYFKCECADMKDFNDCFIDVYEYAKWITFFVDRLSSFCTMTVDELKKAGKATRFHTVSGKELEKLKKILLNKSLDIQRIFSQEESESYYELSFGSSNGRIFGYLIDNKYYILLLDPNHLLYINPSKGAKHCLKNNKYDPWRSLGKK